MRIAPMISRLIVDPALPLVEDQVVGHHTLGKRTVGRDQSGNCLVDHAFGMTAHGRDPVAERRQFLVIGAHGVVRIHRRSASCK